MKSAKLLVSTLNPGFSNREAGHMTEQAMTANPKLAVGWIFRGYLSLTIRRPDVSYGHLAEPHHFCPQVKSD
jgi:hypothetical protein